VTSHTWPGTVDEGAKDMSDGLVEDVFINRPDDDELAFLQYEKLFRGPLDAALFKLQEEDRDRYWDSHNHFMQTYINQVIATVKALNLDALDYWVNNPASANDEKNFKQIKYDIDATVTGIKVRHAQLDRKTSVRLEQDTREKIRDFINKIKLTIEGIELPLPRKEALMGKLNAFAAEVDRDRTRLAAFGALIIEASSGAAKIERKLRPIRKWLDSVAGIMHEARAIEDARPALAAPSKRLQTPPKRITAPSEKLPTGELWAPQIRPKPDTGDLDDEIPF
jgi:hypothetical protein